MDPITIGTIGARVIGGLLGRRDAKRARQQELEDDATRFTRLRDAAEAAGFNPLTALQYGGTTGGLAVGGPAPLSTTQFWTEGLQDVAAELTGEAAAERELRSLETRLAQLRIEGAEAELRAGVLGPETQRVLGQRSVPVSAGSVGRGFNAAASAAQTVNGLPVPTSEIGGVMLNGELLPTDPNATPAEWAEAQYGEIGGEVVGISNFFNDFGSMSGVDQAAMLGFHIDPNGPAARVYNWLTGSEPAPAFDGPGGDVPSPRSRPFNGPVAGVPSPRSRPSNRSPQVPPFSYPPARWRDDAWSH